MSECRHELSYRVIRTDGTLYCALCEVKALRQRLAAAEAALHGIDVKKCEQCGGLRLKVTTPFCACNVEFATGTIS
jgi:hypothetical protein